MSAIDKVVDIVFAVSSLDCIQFDQLHLAWSYLPSIPSWLISSHFQLAFLSISHLRCMANMADPESVQKPNILSVLGDSKLPVDSTQQSVHSSKPASIRSEASFKSVASYLSATGGAQDPASSSLISASDYVVPSGPIRTPLTCASPQTKAPRPATLTPDQEVKYSQVLAAVSAWTTISTTTTKGAKNAPITEDEQMWLSRECLLRYLRATKWKVPDALKRLQGTLSWRREYGADTFTADYISPENETGKQVILGYDVDARPCLYLNPGKQNTKMSDRQIHHLSYMLDRVIDMMGPGQETTALLINFKGATSGSTPTVGQAKQVLNILQGHNPERLGKALISEREPDGRYQCFTR